MTCNRPFFVLGVIAATVLHAAMSPHSSTAQETPRANEPTKGLAGSDEHPGRRIYVERCISCHGENGAGTQDKHPELLAGDLSVAELTRVITETMPDEKPEECVGDDARAVAEYIHEAFYSPIAQARIRPPRIELSRLTNRQYQNAVADLVASFTGSPSIDERRGLSAEYFNDRRSRGDKRVIERIDATVEFDFGDASPDERIGKDEFAVSWRGSVIAPDTGDYEFIVMTENGARLWVNQDDADAPLIDAWVRSGDMREHRKSVRLLGGRAYPVRLEFFKFKEPTASIKLMWVPPHQSLHAIPERRLSPARTSPTLVVETPFPPDDQSMGYERAAAISKAWDEATTRCAFEVIDKCFARINRLAETRDDDTDERRAEQLQRFCEQFAERAFRRPLPDELRPLIIDRQFAESADAIDGAKRSMLLVLKSPRFLYREVARANDQHDVAARLAFAMWDSIPDEPLRSAAARGELETDEQVRRHAERMMNDPRAASKLRELLHRWLKIDQLPELTKNADAFPGFDAELVSDLRTSLDLFLDDVVKTDPADFRALLLSNDLFVNDRLAAFYGIESPADASDAASPSVFRRVSAPPSERAGVLTHPYLMAGFAYYDTSSPIHRGVFVARSLLGRRLKPPAEAVTPTPPDLQPDLTTRERIQLQTEPAACRTCHAMINPLGFSLEQFDAAGRFRLEEKGKPIDAAGQYELQAGGKAEFRGARELAEFLAASSEVHAAFVEQLFHGAVKQPIRAHRAGLFDDLQKQFAESDFNVRRLYIEIAVAAALQE